MNISRHNQKKEKELQPNDLNQIPIFQICFPNLTPRIQLIPVQTQHRCLSLHPTLLWRLPRPQPRILITQPSAFQKRLDDRTTRRRRSDSESDIFGIERRAEG